VYLQRVLSDSPKQQQQYCSALLCLGTKLIKLKCLKLFFVQDGGGHGLHEKDLGIMASLGDKG
jgi:hypothetical protein